MTEEMIENFETFFIEKEAISPGGKAAIGIRTKKEKRVLTWCIGSSKDFRGAKACALKNIKKVLNMVKNMEEPKTTHRTVSD